VAAHNGGLETENGALEDVRYRPVVADFHHFEKELDPNPDLHLSGKLDPDPFK
jgi:hypothetical protein